MSVGEVTKELVSEFLLPEEKIEGPLLRARKVEIYDAVNKTTGFPLPDAKPIVTFNDVFIINTNKRFLIATRGLSHSVEVKEAEAFKGKLDGIWMVEKSADVSYVISDRSGIYSVLKGKVRVSFSIGMKAETHFISAIVKPVLITLMFVILGLLLAFTVDPILGGILVILGLILLAYKKVFIYNPLMSIESSSEVLIYNVIEVLKSKIVKVAEEKVVEEQANLDAEHIAIKILVHRAVAPETIIEFVKAVAKDSGSLAF